MHPLVMFAVINLERSQRTHDNELIWRNARASEVSAAAVERDGRWALAIARMAASRPAKDPCPTAGATA